LGINGTGCFTVQMPFLSPNQEFTALKVLTSATDLASWPHPLLDFRGRLIAGFTLAEQPVSQWLV